ICGRELDANHSWHPCDVPEAAAYTLVASFEKPVVAASVQVYIASEGIATLSPPLLTVELLHESTPGGDPTSSEFVDSRRVSCRANPIEVSVVHDLTQPFRLTKSVRINFTAPDVSIGAVRLRSSKALNPVAVSQCTARQLYHPSLEKCVNYSCDRPRCPKPVLRNARVVCEGEEEGDACVIRCDDGYVLTGDDSSDRLVCDGGTWTGSGNLCKPVDCKTPLIAHADPMCADGTTFGKTCSFKCRPPARFKGSTCNVTCDQSDYEPVFPQGSRQLSLAQAVVCSGTGQWHPNTDSLECRRKCSKDYIGDGWCDAANNQEHCDWDGGDCCPSTVAGHVVKSFPPNCPADECGCRDPRTRR
ncbi:hypothetical protein V5799_028421, partial [Amblyomma americanum]